MARIVLVHGAFGGSWCWDRVIDGLRSLGHSPEAVDLPGNRANPRPAADVSLDAYADHVCSALAAGPPAVLAGQSMGGVVITQAAARRPESVAGLVYVAAFVPADGQSLGDLVALPEAAGDQVQANLVVEGDPPVAILPPEAALRALYACGDVASARAAAARLAPQPVAPFGQPVSVPAARAEAFAALPRAYVTCLRDQAIRPALQRRMFTAAGCDPVIEIDTDHSPWLSATDELVAALHRVASALEPIGSG
jgi:pimeloyl-ACP methyl ester carboxylesterase